MHMINSGHAALLVWQKTFGCSFGLFCLDSLTVPLLGPSHKQSLEAVKTLPTIVTKGKGLFHKLFGFTLTPRLTLELLWMCTSCGSVLLAQDTNQRHPFQGEQLS